MKTHYHRLKLQTQLDIAITDITPHIREQLADSDIRNGFVTVTSRHTTTAVTINEHEERLVEDVKRFFQRLVPPDDKYLHNDIHLRDCPPDEPENAHSHIVAMLLGSSEVIPVVDGELSLGTWQSVLLVELDGPRSRTVTIQVVGE